MRHHLPTALLACCALLLSACASGSYPGHGGSNPPVMVGPGPGPGAHPLARSITYTCEEGSKVVMTEGQPRAHVTFNSGLELSLASTGPGRWGAGKAEFRTAGGGEGVLYATNGRAFRCRVL